MADKGGVDGGNVFHGPGLGVWHDQGRPKKSSESDETKDSPPPLSQASENPAPFVISVLIKLG